MDKPTKLITQSGVYIIEYRNEETVGLGEDSVLYQLGGCNYVNGKIWVYNNEDRIIKEMKSTLLHECLHALAHTSGFELDDETIEHIARHLPKFLKDNKELFEYIIED